MVRSCLLRQRSIACSTSGGITFFQRSASPRSMMKVRPTIEVGINKNMIGPPSFKNCHIISFSARTRTTHLDLMSLSYSYSDFYSPPTDAGRSVFVVERELEMPVVLAKFILHSFGPTREGRRLFD